MHVQYTVVANVCSSVFAGVGPVPRGRETCTATRDFVVRDTYTATLCCLKSSSTVSPYANEMQQFSSQGLGKKRHTFDKDGDHSH